MIARALLTAVISLLLIFASAKAETITLSNGDAMELLSALRAIGGLHDQIIKEGNGERAVQVPYKLKAGVVDQISSNILALKMKSDEFDMTRVNLKQQVQALDAGKERDVAEAKAIDDLQALMRTKVQIDLTMIDRKELGRDDQIGNMIPATDMAKIAPVLKPIEEKK